MSKEWVERRTSVDAFSDSDDVIVLQRNGCEGATSDNFFIAGGAFNNFPAVTEPSE